MDESLVEQVRTLYTSSPAEFVAARNVLAKALKQDDRRDDATTIAGLRRPSWIDGALNRVAAEEPAVVGEFVAAARSARRIQHADAEGRRTESLPDALRAVRAAQGRLAAAGNDALVELGRKADLAGVTARLGRIGADPDQLDLLRAGVLGLEHHELVGAFATDDHSDDHAGNDRTDTAGRHASDVATSGNDRDTAAEEQATHRRHVETATRAARAADKEARVAATAARRAADRRDRAAAAVEAAEGALRDAERTLERARAELADHEARASEAERAADEAAGVASEAATRLDDLRD